MAQTKASSAIKGSQVASTQAASRRSDSRPAATARRRAVGKILPPDERMKYIAEAAYYRALERGFAGGDATADWLAAEAEIDARYQLRVN